MAVESKSNHSCKHRISINILALIYWGKKISTAEIRRRVIKYADTHKYCCLTPVTAKSGESWLTRALSGVWTAPSVVPTAAVLCALGAVQTFRTHYVTDTHNVQRIYTLYHIHSGAVLLQNDVKKYRRRECPVKITNAITTTIRLRFGNCRPNAHSLQVIK